MMLEFLKHPVQRLTIQQISMNYLLDCQIHSTGAIDFSLRVIYRMKTICLSALLYTLKDQPVAENLYLNIFNIWLSKVIENAELNSNDALHIFIDSRTAHHINNTPNVLPILLSKLKCPVAFFDVPSPTTPLEGMMERYKMTNYSQDVYIYTDIDILILKPLSELAAATTEDKIYAAVEGTLEDPNYGAAMKQPIPVCTPPIPGFSSGKFIITSKVLHNNFCNDIRGICDSSEYYTLDQPFFNKVIHSYHGNNKDFQLLTRYVSVNGHNYDKFTILLDGMGNVGNGSIHYKKMTDLLCLISAGVF